MKMLKLIAVGILAVGLCAAGQEAQPPAEQAGGTTGQAAQGPTIKDPAEYNAYMAAIGMQNPSQKAAALEQFLAQYPSTVVKKDALQQILGAYQQAGNMPKAVEASTQLLQADPNNVYALFVLAYNNLAGVQRTGNQQQAAAAEQYGERGLQALASFAKPSGMAEESYTKLKTAMTATFTTAIGIGALQRKDYPTAIKYLGEEAETNPNDLTIIYPLATAYLQQKPLNPLGFWYGARAVNLSSNNQVAHQQITKYIQGSYDNYHGGDDGWQQMVQQAAASPNPPAGFNVTQMTPSVQAQNLYNQGGGDCKKMDPATWEFIFQNGEQALADKCMAEIKGIPFQIQTKVVEASKDKLMLATSEDDINSNTADAEVMMADAIPLRQIPKEGTMRPIQANPVSYDKQPYMLHMDQGKFVAPKKPAPTRRHAPRRRRPASR